MKKQERSIKFMNGCNERMENIRIAKRVCEENVLEEAWIWNEQGK